MQLAEIHECIISPMGPRPEEVHYPPLRVLIDARKIFDGGIGVYIRNLINGFLSVGGVNVSALVRPEQAKAVQALGEVTVIESSAGLYSVEEFFFLSKRIDFTNFDVFHSPHYTLPFGVPIPTVVTIHDTIHISHPDRFYYPFIARRLIRSALKRATKVLTVSNASKRELLKVYPKAEAKISVIPNAVDPYFLVETCLGEGIVEITHRADYFVSTLSNHKSHKGIPDLLLAFEALKNLASTLSSTDPIKAQIERLELVLVGTGTAHLPPQMKLPPQVKVVGEVSVKELQHLYSRAIALVVPSLAEGFCLPVIEAQACATPTIARPVPAVLELMTTNDYVCKDFSLPAFVDGMIGFLRRRHANPDSFDGVPLSHMRRFCREDVSRSVLEVYHELLKAED